MTTKPVALIKTTVPVARPAAQGGSVKLAAGVNAALAAAQAPPKTLRLGRTSELKDHVFMHALIYSETSARKTTTAAKFGNRENTRFIRGWCLEVHDLAIAKYAAGREKDRAFTRGLARHAMVSRDVLNQGLAVTRMDPELRAIVTARVQADFAAAAK